MSWDKGKGLAGEAAMLKRGALALSAMAYMVVGAYLACKKLRRRR